MNNLMLDIDYFLKKKGKDLKQLYKDMGLSKQTYYNRLDDPDNMTIGEYKRLVLECDLPSELVVEHMRKSASTPTKVNKMRSKTLKQKG